MAKNKVNKSFEDIIKQMKKSNNCIVVTEKGINYVGDLENIIRLYDSLTLGIINVDPTIDTYILFRDYFKQIANILDNHIKEIENKKEVAEDELQD